MGYLPNYNPSKRWFCGRVFLQEAKQLIESEEQKLKSGKINKYSLPNLTLARLNILRGVRTVLLLPPDVNGFSLAELTEQIKEKIPYDLYRKFSDLMFPDFSIYYATSSRWGIWKCYLKDKKGNEYKLNIDENFGKQRFIINAVKERLANLQDLMKITYDIFFEMYLKDKDYDLFYYPYDETHEIEDMYDDLVIEGIVSSEEEARQKFGDDPYELYLKFKELFDRLHIEEFKRYHHDMFWEWKEEDALCKSTYLP